MLGTRESIDSGLTAIISLIDKGGVLVEKEVIEQAYQNVKSQMQLALAMLRLELPQDVSEITSTLLANPVLKKLMEVEFTKHSSETLIHELESTMTRREAAILRTLASDYLIRRSADLLGLNLTRSVGDTIRREIRFPPELKQAGIGILSYFQQIITTKYPDMDVGIAIEQRGDRVILTIDTPDGEKERIEQELHEYGLVVIGQTKPEDYLPTPLDVVRLKHRLEMAALETRHVRDILYSERSQYESRIKALESHTELLRDLLDHDRYLTRKLTEDISQMALTSSNSVTHLVNELSTLIKSEPTAEREQEFAKVISEIKAVEPSLINRLEELLLKGAIQGAAGNYLYAWLQILGRWL
jgi:phosphoribosylformylglycinamidine (FGAM) synthase PurS component